MSKSNGSRGWCALLAIAMTAAGASSARAHDLPVDAQPWAARTDLPRSGVGRLVVLRAAGNEKSSSSIVSELIRRLIGELEAGRAKDARPGMATAFDPFKDHVKVRWDERWLYVESNGMPDHRMMVGITAWQQQVPLPQPYTGTNAWQIPLHPVVSKDPLSAKTHFFRGAIALAVNGVPIFNPIKNDGHTDTFLAGELDEFGGHCGRGDDYHYHLPPLHLQKLVGLGKPVAFALDGYPIYGLAEPDGTPVGKLDEFNGHADASGAYHYHATKSYPYLNGGFHGEVVDRGGQVDPQPRASGIRDGGRPLRGAKITGFSFAEPNAYALVYEVDGKQFKINYLIEEGGTYRFQFIDDSGKSTTQTYHRKRDGGPPVERVGANVGQGNDGAGRRPENPEPAQGRPGGDFHLLPRSAEEQLRLTSEQANRVAELSADVNARLEKILTPEQVKVLREARRPPGPDRPAPEDRAEAGRAPANPAPATPERGAAPAVGSRQKADSTFVLRSPEVADGGPLPREFTGDGSAATLPLEWSGAPVGTNGYALIMHHLDPEGKTKWYWILYDIPSDVHKLPKNVAGVGKLGNNSVNRHVGYAPPHSKGPGVKKYVLTLYALSAPPQITAAPEEVNYDVLLAAMKDHVLASTDLNVTYDRSDVIDAGRGEKPDGPNAKRGPK